MNLTSDQTHMESNAEKVAVRGPSGGGVRGPLNWFGFVFGVVVLLGVGLLFLLTEGPDRAVENVDAGEVAAEPMPVETPDEAAETEHSDEAATQPAVETPDEAAETEHSDEAATQPAVETPDEAVETPDEAATQPAVETPDEAAETAHADEAATEPTVDATGKTVIEIEMVDYAYTPDTVDIQAGVPVVFRFTNTGNFEHEAMVGDMHQQEEFAAEEDHDADEGHHGDVMAVLVQPGQTADLEVLVDEPGTTYMACHVPGHYERGQIATINVTA